MVLNDSRYQRNTVVFFYQWVSLNVSHQKASVFVPRKRLTRLSNLQRKTEKLAASQTFEGQWRAAYRVFGLDLQNLKTEIIPQKEIWCTMVRFPGLLLRVHQYYYVPINYYLPLHSCKASRFSSVK